MTREDLKTEIVQLVPGATFEEGGEWQAVMIDAASWLELARQIKVTPGLEFDYLFCLTCVDWKTHLTMVYFLTSTLHRHTLVVKSKLDRDNPEIESVSSLWQTAELNEREVFDLFGVKFLNHPDLRRLLLTDEWVGFPLRKDYDDPVNMIKL